MKLCKISLFLIVFFGIATAQPEDYRTYSYFNINKIPGSISSVGRTYTERDILYQSSYLMFVGKKGEEIRASGGYAWSSLMPGAVLQNGQADDPSLESNRVFRVRPDYKTAELTAERVSFEILDAEQVRANYQIDWDEWPADKGAPFDDKNDNGIYEPDIDIPGVPGADQTLWYVCNDIDTSISPYGKNSGGLGLEIQETVWGYNLPGTLDNVMFRKFTVINKGEDSIDSLFFSILADIDVMTSYDWNDDFMGCDTTLGMFYGYESQNIISETRPNIASGVILLKGPVELNTLKEVPVSSYTALLEHSHDEIGLPSFGGYESGALRYFNQVTNNFQYYCYGDTTRFKNTFPLSGNPITGNGDIEDDCWGPRDIFGLLNVGAIDMAPGDKQEIIFAIVNGVAGDRFGAIEVLKQQAYELKSMFGSGVGPEHLIPRRINAEVVNENDKININWAKDNSIESFDNLGYKFQGYNVYQCVNGSFEYSMSKKVATFDLADNITTIYGQVYDGWLDALVGKPVHEGNDTGLEYSLTLSGDLLEDSDFIKGKEYYYIVSAYTFNPESEDFPSTESFSSMLSTKYNHELPGSNFGESLEVEHISGNGNADVRVSILSPDLIKGDRYEVTFDNVASGSTVWNLKKASTNEFIYFAEPVNTKKITEGISVSVDYSAYNFSKIVNNELIRNGTVNDTIFKSNISSYAYQLVPYDLLDDSYELRFTGEYITNSDGIVVIKPGTGSVALTNMDNNPLRPDSIDSWEKYALTVPFELWNTSLNQQVSLRFNEYSYLSDYPQDSSYSEKEANFAILDKPYTEDPFEATPQEYSGEIIRMLYFKNLHWQRGDVVRLTFPEQISSEDVYSFRPVKIGGNEEKFELKQNYPNPFNSYTNIEVEVPESGDVRIDVFNSIGELVRTIKNEYMPDGKYRLRFAGNGLASGVYFYRVLINGKYNTTKKMMLLK